MSYIITEKMEKAGREIAKRENERGQKFINKSLEML